MVRISAVQRATLKQTPQRVSGEDADSAGNYILVEESIGRRATLAMNNQQDPDARRRGVAQLEAGSGTPVANACQQPAPKLSFSSKG